MSNSVRIRYGKAVNGVYTSVKKFMHPTLGSSFKVVLNTVQNQWLVINDLTDLVEVSGSQTSLHRMKIEAKQALLTIGVSFESEERTSKNKTTSNAA